MSNDQPASTHHTPAEPIHLIREALEKLRFGGIQLTVHEGRLVQMDVTERQRFQT